MKAVLLSIVAFHFIGVLYCHGELDENYLTLKKYDYVVLNKTPKTTAFDTPLKFSWPTNYFNPFLLKLIPFYKKCNNIIENCLAGISFSLNDRNKYFQSTNSIKKKQYVESALDSDKMKTNILTRLRRNDNSTFISLKSDLNISNTNINKTFLTSYDMASSSPLSTQTNSNNYSTTIQSIDSSILTTPLSQINLFNHSTLIGNIDSSTFPTTLSVQMNPNNYTKPQNISGVVSDITVLEDENAKSSTYLELNGSIILFFLLAVSILSLGLALITYQFYHGPFRGSRRRASYEVRNIFRSGAETQI